MNAVMIIAVPIMVVVVGFCELFLLEKFVTSSVIFKPLNQPKEEIVKASHVYN